MWKQWKIEYGEKFQSNIAENTEKMTSRNDLNNQRTEYNHDVLKCLCVI